MVNILKRPLVLKLIRFCLITFLYVFNAAIITYIFLTCPGLNNWGLVSFENIVTLNTQKPFVTRTLVPSMLREVKKWVPPSFEERLKSAIAKDKTISEKLTEFGWDKKLLVEYFLFCLLVFACYLGFQIVMRSLLKSVFELPDIVNDMAPIVCLLTVPNLYSTVNYIYDPMALFLGATAFLFLARNQIVMFTGLFVLACFNKETAILLLIPFFFFQRQRHVEVMWPLIGLGAIWLCIRGGIFWAYQDFPGVSFENHLWENLSLLPSIPTKLWKHFSPLVLLGVLMAIDWSSKPKPLKSSLVWMLAILIPLWLISGRVYEIRVFYEIYPLILLLAVPGVMPLYNKGTR